jgi:DNA-binding phage protein
MTAFVKMKLRRTKMIKTTKWSIFDDLKTEEDIYYYLLAAKDEKDDYIMKRALKTVQEARRRLKLSETTDWSSDEYDFEEFEPENSKELAYA